MSDHTSKRQQPGFGRALDDAVRQLTDELIEFRRDLHAHPELAWAESRTTERVADRLAAGGITVQVLPKSGLVAQVGSQDGPVVALRADLDALPVDDRTDDPWRSKNDGVAHACGHDVHATALLGAGLALHQLCEAGHLPGGVRLLFQPAEEVMPGGALEMLAAGALDGVTRAFGLHCDPSLDVGHVGLRVGPITGAADSLRVRLGGSGGHTSRPHLTQDLTYALGQLVTQLPAALSRRLDPRAGASVVWGLVRAGSAPNVIPASGEAAGTVRMLDAVAWADAECLVREIVHQIVAPYGVEAEVTYTRNVPPVDNEPTSVDLLSAAVLAAEGPDALIGTEQSLGGEDFAWYLENVPGALARLGTHSPDWDGPMLDLHRGTFDVDERAIGVGTRFLVTTALTALGTDGRDRVPAAEEAVSF